MWVAVMELHTDRASTMMSIATLLARSPSRSIRADCALNGPWQNSCPICRKRSPWSAASHKLNSSDDHVLRVTFRTRLQTWSIK